MNKQAGFTLIEVLISAVLLAVGLLGVAALQTTATKLTYEANLRAKAVLLAYDMVDRMRANMDYSNITSSGVQFYPFYNGIDTTQNYTNQNCSQDDGTPSATGCTQQQMAQYDAWRWAQDIQAALPDGVGTVKQQINLAGNPFYTIKITWDDLGTATDVDTVTLTIQP